MADVVATSIDSKIDYLKRSIRPHGDTIYMILPFAKVTAEMVEESCETSIDTLRHTTSGKDLVVLKWSKYAWKYAMSMPTVLSPYSKDATFKVYSYTEILEELKKPEWQSSDEDLQTTTKTTTKSIAPVG